MITGDDAIEILEEIRIKWEEFKQDLQRRYPANGHFEFECPFLAAIDEVLQECDR